ncbi:MAG: class I poly(R)-hydroxyalkanoic acid synthase [Casimicrobiaceae bacterium]
MSPREGSTLVSWADLAAECLVLGQAWAQWWMSEAQAVPGAALGKAPPSCNKLLQDVTAKALPHPHFDMRALTELNTRFQMRFQTLADATRNGTAPPADLVSAVSADRRFHAPAWREQPFFAWLAQSYLLHKEYIEEMTALADLPAEDKRRLEFATQQYLAAIAPTNFPATNPEVVARAFATEGGSLAQGIRNLLDDTHRGRITMSDERAFTVGGNLAVTPGSVVYRNDLIELIQYAAATKRVHDYPLVIIPPCINKYYVLDLRPENSFVRHAVAAGHTVFIVSWRNIPAELGSLTWDDYIERGTLQAIRVAQNIGRSKTVNALGFCVGGTMLAAALAVLAERNDRSVASATLLTTMLDFDDPGDIGVYVSRELLAAREPALMAGQRVRGQELANAFASLRANDLVWHYVVDNYLKGASPPAFDLLYWNADSANLPGPMYVYYLRNLYLDNRMREPNSLTMARAPIDLKRITVPTYVLATRDDHIVPWRAAYQTTQLLSGDTTFVLGAAGHIAGVINPPTPPRRQFWTNEIFSTEADGWLARAAATSGSWWPHWTDWLGSRSGVERKAPRRVGNAKYPPLAPAPGLYVLESPG